MITGREFIENTKYKNMKGYSDQAMGKPQPALQVTPGRDASIISLDMPESDDIPLSNLRYAIESRSSIRSYSREALSVTELSYLLWITQGVKEIFEGHATMRTVPSAGARHALETYLLINNVKGIKKGIYRYLALDHALLDINAASSAAREIEEACLGQDIVTKCAVTFFWTVDIYRMTWRYGERGYRYIFLDAGHACQNLYLGAVSTGCGVCAIGAFEDDAINRILGLDGENHFTIYGATVGKR